MGMPVQKKEWTAEMARALPDDGKRYEVLDGELFVSPAPSLRHQAVLARLYDLLRPYVAAHRLGWLWWSPADIEFSPKRQVQPDLFLVPNEGRGEPRDWKEVKSLLLVIEATSPSTARADRTKKVTIYGTQLIPEYWIVDVDAHVIERWRPSDKRPEIISDVLEWQPKPEIEPLRIELTEVFGPER